MPRHYYTTKEAFKIDFPPASVKCSAADKVEAETIETVTAALDQEIDPTVKFSLCKKLDALKRAAAATTTPNKRNQ